jgi:hypothetical protein
MVTNTRERVKKKEKKKKGNWCLENIHKHYDTKAVSVTVKQCLGGMQHEDCL